MNVCILNSCWSGGGAEAISRSLYEGMQQFDEFNMYFVSGQGPLEETNRIFPIARAKMIPDRRLRWKMIVRKNLFLTTFRGELRHEGYATKWLINFIRDNHIDILHINNLHGAFLGIKDVKKLSHYCKVVWTMHDMWTLTGHCVYAFDCHKWVGRDCSNCPRPGLACEVKGNVSRRSLKDKAKYFANADITFVAISQWMKDNFYKSVLKDEKVVLIHNGIDIDTYREKNRIDNRASLEIGEDEFVILFVANGVESPFKGVDVLLQALKYIPGENRQNTTLLVCGKIEDTSVFAELDGYKIQSVGYISDSDRMADMYSAADVFVAPSRAEAFSLVVVESMACGTPVIGSNAGGIPELITDETGWVFENGDAEALSQLICQVRDMHSSGELDNMRGFCRNRAENYDRKIFLENYRSLYLSV